MAKKKKEEPKVTSTFDTSMIIKIRYSDEAHFNKLSRSLKTYNMLAYKDFIFFYMKSLRNHGIPGEEIEPGRYRCYFRSNEIFDLVYGKPYFEYSVNGAERTLEKLEPEDFLLAGYRTNLESYKGVPIRDARDRFKVDLAMTMSKKEGENK